MVVSLRGLLLHFKRYITCLVSVGLIPIVSRLLLSVLESESRRIIFVNNFEIASDPPIVAVRVAGFSRFCDSVLHSVLSKPKPSVLSKLSETSRNVEPTLEPV